MAFGKKAREAVNYAMLLLFTGAGCCWYLVLLLLLLADAAASAANVAAAVAADAIIAAVSAVAAVAVVAIIELASMELLPIHKSSNASLVCQEKLLSIELCCQMMEV